MNSKWRLKENNNFGERLVIWKVTMFKVGYSKTTQKSQELIFSQKIIIFSNTLKIQHLLKNHLLLLCQILNRARITIYLILLKNDPKVTKDSKINDCSKTSQEVPELQIFHGMLEN